MRASKIRSVKLLNIFTSVWFNAFFVIVLLKVLIAQEITYEMLLHRLQLDDRSCRIGPGFIIGL